MKPRKLEVERMTNSVDAQSCQKILKYTSDSDFIKDDASESKTHMPDKDALMRHVVVWSGGIDSTLILIDLIRRGICPTVLTFMCNAFGGSHMQEFEQAARINILKYIASEYSYDISDPETIELNIKSILSPYGSAGGLIQQPYMMAMVSLFSTNNTCYHMGYHKGDDFWTYSYDLISAHTHILSIEGGKHIELSFPLRHMTKADIISKLKEYKFPIDLCTYCYNPTYKGPCGECDACKMHEKAMQELMFNKRRSNDISYESDVLPVLESDVIPVLGNMTPAFYREE